MIDVKQLLYEICDDERVLESDTELLESGILDSLAFIELFSRLEEEGLPLQPTQIDRSSLRTPGQIEKLIREAEKNSLR